MPESEVQRKLRELEPRILDRLQDRKRGQTVDQLQAHLKAPQSFILSVLYKLKAEGQVSESKRVWKLEEPML